VNSQIRHYRVRRCDIAFLRHVLEACDGVAFLRTVDARVGLVALHIPPGRETEAEDVMRGLQTVLPLAAELALDSAGLPHA
jgi:hypothetical protein